MTSPNNQPLVSIIMPSYNSAQFVEKSVNSALAQTYKNFELVVVDDASTDTSPEIVQRLAENDPRIKVVSNTSAKGATGARNCGVHHSKGFYVAFLDSDDLWHPDKLKIQIQFMRKNGIDFSYSNYEMFMENPERRKLIISPSMVKGTDILKKCDIGCLTVVLEKSLLPERPFNSVHKEDYSLWVDLIYNQKKVAHNCNECLAYYRKLNQSRSGVKFKELRKQLFVLQNTAKLPLVFCIKHLITYSWNGYNKHRY